MRFTAYTACTLLASVLAVASPTKHADSVARAIARGIDIHGPIPSDAVKVEEGHWTAQPGTEAWDWIRAQIDMKPEEHTATEKREYANIGIGMFAQDSCRGEASWFDNVQYDVQHVGHTNYYSVGISYRGLRSNEQLDFSRLQGNDWCGRYLYSAGQNTPDYQLFQSPSPLRFNYANVTPSSLIMAITLQLTEM
ncbi:hypothetical protein QQS21_003575 [Conoideocrella luteorostrata]|uniref:Uncharacterized protein n=1 Tax=Conoideocrella luteorostrata TaxID=1105319 RepID=A0AAJ0CX84_9HYPO|nr:hypothetical protein QQS21_003575 [Conoideocrella luteorostrata]